MFSLLRAPYFQYYDYFLSEYTCKREKGVVCLKIILHMNHKDFIPNYSHNVNMLFLDVQVSFIVCRNGG